MSNQVFALKVFKKNLEGDCYKDKYLLQKFNEEIRILKNMKHTNIVKMHDSGNDGTITLTSGQVHKDVRYILLEYIEGQTLYDVIF